MARPRGQNHQSGSQSTAARNRAPQICHQFQRGTCRYGAKCKFSHDVAGTERATSNVNKTVSSAEETMAREQYFQWKRLIRKADYEFLHSKRGEEYLFRIWDNALDILDGDGRELHQLLIKDLVADELDGHEVILATTSTTPKNIKTFLEMTESFLKVLTHPALLNCLSIDTFVGTMYASFAGTNGDRAIEFLERIRKLLIRGESKMDGRLVETILEGVGLLQGALRQLLSRDRRARFHDKLPMLVDLLDTLVFNIPEANTFSLKPTLDYLKKLCKQATDSLITAEPEGTKASNSQSIRSSFPTEMQMPGGRHDNDFANISQIKILPTRGEILSDHAEYLPSTNFKLPHVLEDPLQRYIDTTFRLLRHDVFGSVKDVLRELLKHEDPNRAPLSGKDTRAHLYSRSSIRHLFTNDRNELEALLYFLPPLQISKRSLADQRQWWQMSSRLDEGTLVCFMSSTGSSSSLLFLQVTVKSTSKSNSSGQNKSNDEGQGRNENESCLVSGNQLSSITVKLAARVPSDVNRLLQLYHRKTQGILVDFHGIIPATFYPILSNLQRIQSVGDLNFRKWILPTSDDNDVDDSQIPPPIYSRGPGFTFSLDPIAKHGAEPVQINPDTPLELMDLQKIETSTGLDKGQCEGLIAALTREYALIQGPPGTGKSYLGVQLVRVLLAAKDVANLGPIIVICYTNHALDQFLKHLLEVGVEKIIRIGGRSQASELGGKNLRVVDKSIPKTRVEMQTLGKSYQELETCMETAEHNMKYHHKSRKALSWAILGPYLKQSKHRIHQQLSPVEDNGFTKVTGDPLKSWIGKMKSVAKDSQTKPPHDHGRLFTLNQAAKRDIHSVPVSDRQFLAESWFDEFLEGQGALLFEAIDRAEALRSAIHNVHEEVNRRALVQADVVGITTTALAKNIETLRRVGAKVVICEEAAEVMEAHVISALMPGVEHFIQIGDHQQLRPQIQNYALSLESQSGLDWQLDRSQFERRAMGEPGMSPVPLAQLNIQRRMRPEISQLITRVYPTLQDHESVLNLPDVVGMKHNLFWLDHRSNEDGRDDGPRLKSHSNQWEVDMATALVRHLVRQGEYRPDDIALLTPYTGQLQKLKTVLSKDFEICLNERDLATMAAEGFEDSPQGQVNGKSNKPVEKKQLLQTLRLATVDNFQGEEAKVIVVSLVRSNSQRKVGFLRTENRINVLLSRAQHGLYLIGNSETYLKVPMWADVYDRLSRMNAVGTGIGLCCPRHPEYPIVCSEPEDFARRSPEGGCNLPCTLRLEPCGHRCQARCHSDIMHNGFSCSQPCPRIRTTCDHICARLCGEPCGPCKVVVENVLLPCGHTKNQVLCHETQNLESVKCDAAVIKTVPGCGHDVSVPCFRDVTSELFRCNFKCSEILGCGHTCTGSCKKCRKEGLDGIVTFEHRNCTKECDRPYGACNHRCPKPCHDGSPCGNCESTCEVRCPHSACASKCGKACTPCIEMCTWHCAHHGACSMPCAAPCNRLPCEERCNKILGCGHQCPSFCGEDCPRDFCQSCGDNSDARVDLLEFKPYSEINLDECPIIVLPCGHAFTGETLDGLVGLDEVYTRDKKGNFNGLADVSVSLATQIPSCPDCKRPIRQFATRRYNRAVNCAVMDETCKRFITNGRHELASLEEKFVTVEQQRTLTGHALTGKPNDRLLLGRKKAFSTLRLEALTLSKRMATEHQPLQKLLDAIKTSQSSTAGADLTLSQRFGKLKISQAAVDSQITLGARLIYLRAFELILDDMFALQNVALDKNPRLKEAPHHLAVDFLEECREFVMKAKEANLSRIMIQGTLLFAKVAQLDSRHHGILPGEKSSKAGNLFGTPLPADLKSVEGRRQIAHDLLLDAEAFSANLPNCTELQEKIQMMARLFEGHRYEAMTQAEIDSIKTAMVTGQGGMATNSGHWYNCVNGHPFAIGECGMPMEMAKCPECGAPIGGSNHEAVAGVSRATSME